MYIGLIVVVRITVRTCSSVSRRRRSQPACGLALRCDACILGNPIYNIYSREYYYTCGNLYIYIYIYTHIVGILHV